jgi:hypothetical protein
MAWRIEYKLRLLESNPEPAMAGDKNLPDQKSDDDGYKRILRNDRF